jgi:hypothetical protein
LVPMLGEMGAEEGGKVADDLAHVGGTGHVGRAKRGHQLGEAVGEREQGRQHVLE